MELWRTDVERIDRSKAGTLKDSERKRAQYRRRSSCFGMPTYSKLGRF
jgi:hypothetical protein